jgi:hypothetical protein
VAFLHSRQRAGRHARPGLDAVREIAAVQFPASPALGGRTSFGLRRLLAHMQAQLFRSSLDSALAAGANPCESPALAHRAARLTTRKGRAKLAASAEAVLAAAARPPAVPTSAVEPQRDEIISAAPLLIEIVELLRSTTPVYSQGVAMLKRLLQDDGSPVYAPTSRGTLDHELRRITAALEGREEPSSRQGGSSGL